MKRIKLCCLVCALLLVFASGCGDKSELKSELENIRLTMELPPVTNEGSTRLAEIDEDVYQQQLAACEMYYEAYDITRTSDYVEKYKDELKDKKVGYYCNERRKALQLDIATALNDNVYVMVKTVEDCDNIAAYLKRVNYDVENFYDYYAAYLYSDDSENALCDILTTFYERSNILALSFMAENKDEVVAAAVKRIEENARETESLNMYIVMNNEIIKALNTVYGGVPSYYVDTITSANISLARKLLEADNDLSAEEIDKLMYQLGEPTPSPEPTATPEPTPEPTEKPVPTSVPVPAATVPPVSAPSATKKPVSPPTQAPAQQPQTNNEPAPTPQIYYFDLD